MSATRQRPLGLTLLFGLALCWGSSARDATESDSVAALRRLVEEQNRKIEALSEKVHWLEQREEERVHASNQVSLQLPTIVIDTNGVPLSAPLAAGAPTSQPARAPEPAASFPSNQVGQAAPAAPRLGVGADGFVLSSADTNFVLRLRGLLQVDSRTFFGDNPWSQGNDGFLVRRARPIMEGTVYRDFDFALIPDFAGSSAQIFDANLNYRYRPELQLLTGKFRGPVGLEQLMPTDVYGLFNERSMVSDLVPARNIGMQLWGEVATGAVSYAAGIFTASSDGRNPTTAGFSDAYELGGRVFLQPFKPTSLTALRGFGFGLGGSYSEISSNAAGLPSTTGGTLPGYFTAGQQQFFAYNPLVGPVVADGAHWRLSPQSYWCYGPFGVLGEYILSDQKVLNAATLRRATLDHRAWQVSGQWVLTGENASFTGITPRRKFDPRTGGWGAWQLVGRLGALEIDPTSFQGFSNPAASARSATAWSVGINWWLNKNLRVLTSYSQTLFDGGGAAPNPFDPTTLVPPATVTHQDEKVFFTRLQLAF
jgi:phosphate-selective porin OprO and OprP